MTGTVVATVVGAGVVVGATVVGVTTDVAVGAVVTAVVVGLAAAVVDVAGVVPGIVDTVITATPCVPIVQIPTSAPSSSRTGVPSATSRRATPSIVTTCGSGEWTSTVSVGPGLCSASW